MSFVVKDWKDYDFVTGIGDASTPITEAALEDMETRLSTYTDRVTGGRTFYPEQFNASAGTGGNDTTAFRDCMNAIASAGGGTMRLRDGATYLLNSAPDTSKNGNAIVPLPNTMVGVAFPYIRIVGNGNTKLKTTRTTDTYSATYGIPSILGGPTEEGQNTDGVTDPLPLQTTVIIEGVRFEAPTNNPTIAGVDLLRMGRAGVYHVCVETTGNHTALMTTPYTFGLRMPGALKLGMSRMQEVLVTGYYCGFALQGGHQHMAHTNVKWCRVGYGIVDQNAITGAARVDPHMSPWLHVQSQWCTNHLAGWDRNGVKSTPSGRPFNINGSWDIEDGSISGGNIWATSNHILDANNEVAGEITYVYVEENVGVVARPLTITGASKLKMNEARPEVNNAWQVAAVSGLLDIPHGRDHFEITTATNINQIPARRVGDKVTLRATNASSFSLLHGTVNLILVGSANVTMTQNDMIQLVWDGTNWRQCANVVTV